MTSDPCRTMPSGQSIFWLTLPNLRVWNPNNPSHRMGMIDSVEFADFEEFAQFSSDFIVDKTRCIDSQFFGVN